MSISLSYRGLAKDYAPGHMKMSEEEYVAMKLTMAMERGDFIDYTDKSGKEERLPRIDHHPELKEYEVWREGFSVQGNDGQADLVGRAMARNWRQACDIVMCQEFLKAAQEENAPDNTRYFSPHGWPYDSTRMTYWGCRLYPREDWARATHG